MLRIKLSYLQRVQWRCISMLASFWHLWWWWRWQHFNRKLTHAPHLIVHKNFVLMVRISLTSHILCFSSFWFTNTLVLTFFQKIFFRKVDVAIFNQEKIKAVSISSFFLRHYSSRCGAVCRINFSRVNSYLSMISPQAPQQSFFSVLAVCALSLSLSPW